MEGSGGIKQMKLTFEEHKLIGRALKLINHKVNSGNYTFKNKKEFCKSHVTKAFELTSKLKNHMEEIMFKDYPEQATTDIYYGGLD
jgi:hypothetical protein